ncbi:zinc finger protein 423-like isoform X2 [Cloeon dipterum]|uniref:zinc finger protein 423-like isoform X2 n=1 Tax=Cloeon dipterum TaxID=197152 RepID=UPI00322028D3
MEQSNLDGNGIKLKTLKPKEAQPNLDEEYNEHILNSEHSVLNTEEQVDNLSEDCIQELLRESPVEETERNLWQESEIGTKRGSASESDADPSNLTSMTPAANESGQSDFVEGMEGSLYEDFNGTLTSQSCNDLPIFARQLKDKETPVGTPENCNSDPKKTVDINLSGILALPGSQPQEPSIDDLLVNSVVTNEEIEGKVTHQQNKAVCVKSAGSDIFSENTNMKKVLSAGNEYSSKEEIDTVAKDIEVEKLPATELNESTEHETKAKTKVDDENDSDTDVRNCIADVLRNIDDSDNSLSSNTSDVASQNIQITDLQTISNESFFDKDEATRIDRQDQTSCPSRPTSGESPNMFRIITPTYVYTRQRTSPLDIAISDMVEEDTQDINQSQDVDFVKETSNRSETAGQNISESADEFLLTPSLSSELEEFTGFEKQAGDAMTTKSRALLKTINQNKFMKVAYSGLNYLYKTEKLAESFKELDENCLEDSMQQCQGCHFKMSNPRSPHNCIPNFCIACQVDAGANFSVHLLEEHINLTKTCPFCLEEMASLHQLVAHLEKHTSIKLRPSICISCKTNFKTLEGRILHKCPNSSICNICNKVFKSEDTLNEHVELQHKAGSNTVADQGPSIKASSKFSCNICDKPFTTQFTLNLHMKEHFNATEKEDKVDKTNCSADRLRILQTAQNIVKCPHCAVFYLNMKVLSDHLSQVKFCKLCLTQLSTNHEFEAHMVEYHCFERICQFCDDEFANCEELIKHVRVHTLLTIRPYCCTQCESTFSKVENLQNHKCQGKGISTNPVCKTCNVYFQSDKAFEMHWIKKHSLEYLCPVCKLDTSTCSKLLTHVQQEHAADVVISFLCIKCDETFKEDAGYEAHKCVIDAPELSNYPCSDDQSENECSLDDDSRPLACAICGKEFELLEALDKHIAMTVEEATCIAARKHCSFCDVYFATRSSFESHMIQQHLSAMKCPFCLKFFATKFSLEQHLLHHTNLHRSEFYCKSCRRIYFSRGLFQSHLCLSDEESESDKDVLITYSPPNQKSKEVLPATRAKNCHECFICKKSFDSKHQLNIHLKSHKETFSCKICKQHVSGIKAIRDHFQMHKSLSESVKSQAVAKSDALMSPTIKMVKLQVPDEVKKCLPCRRVFKSQEDLNKHKELIHSYASKAKDDTDRTHLNCKFCKIKLESNFWVAFHYTNQHNIMTSLKYQCQTCKVRFYTSQEKYQHSCPAPVATKIVIQKVPILIKKENGGQDKNESQVVMHTTTKRGLPINHLQIDMYNLEHPCSHCSDVFVNQKSLLAHCVSVRYCLNCLIVFKDKDKYEQHMMYIHANSRECVFCRLECKTKADLIQHIKVHTKLYFRTSESIRGRVFACRWCKMTFQKSGSYEKHTLEHHLGKSCPFCDNTLPPTSAKKLAHLQEHTNLDVKKLLAEAVEKKAAAQLKEKQASELAAKKMEAKKKAAAAEALKKANEERTRKKATTLATKIASKTAPKPVEKTPYRASLRTATKSMEKTAAKSEGKTSSKSMEKTAAKSEGKTSSKSMEKTAATSEDRTASKKVEKTASKTPENHGQAAGKGSKAIFQGDLCLLCKKKFRSSALMFHHVMDFHYNNSKKCPFCQKKWTNVGNTKSHIHHYHKVRMTRVDDVPEETPVEAPSPDLPTEPSVHHSNKVPSLGSGSSSSKDRVYSCCICSKSFTNQSILDSHILNVHHMESAKAQLLGKIMASTPADPEPFPQGPNKKTFCFHCHTSFNTATELRAHGIKAGVFCEFCCITLPDSNEYEMHMLEEHPSEDTCQFCGAYIPNKAGLEIHIRRHTKIGPIHYKCFGCNKMFTSSRAKDEHPCIAFACPKCGEEQSSPDGLENHLSTAHMEQQVQPTPAAVEVAIAVEVPLTEKRVGKRKQTQSVESDSAPKKKKPEEDSFSLTSSLQRSEGKKVTSTVECTHCDRRFQSLRSLRNHAGQYKVYCKECKLICSSPEALAEHIKTHNVTPLNVEQTAAPAAEYFKCRYCGEQCKSNVELREHHFSHVAFKCPKCAAVFNTKQKIMDHLKLCQEPQQSAAVIKVEESDSDSDIVILDGDVEVPQYVIL